jgi:hypothetical protein
MPHKLKEIFTKQEIEHPTVPLTFTRQIRRRKIMDNYDNLQANEVIGEEAYY